MESDTNDLQRVSDPELMARWADTRSRLVNAPREKPGRDAIKAEYDRLLAEYRRRMDLGRAPTAGTAA